MKLISFLGGHPYAPADYQYAGEVCHTSVVQEAICKLLGTIDDIVLIATDGAREMTLEAVSAALRECGVGVTAVPIPDGKSEEELWEIFRAVVTSIDDGEEIVFDITHGFRSLPLVGFLSAAFLRTTGKAHISHLLYGQYMGEGHPSPILDLTPFLSILDWTTGVNAFLESVDGKRIRELANQTSKEAYLSGRPDAPVKLSKFAETLDAFSMATRMARPVEALDKASLIAHNVADVIGEIEEFTPPLGMVLDKINAVGELGIAEPDLVTGITWDHAEKQLGLIGYMIERGLFLQGVTLSREWVITLMLLARHGDGYPDWLDKDVRHGMEWTFGAGIRNMRGKYFEDTDYSDWYFSLDSEEVVTRLWIKITEIRNDFAHCGMRSNPTRVPTMNVKSKELYTEMCPLFKQIRETFED
ncbi:MAG TPA: TIGR02221 family CRISPR-associated protein [Methanoculleus sp.]|nr:TIGR02221 family CRISPR-associated protein [Methanoculleus sp.]